MLRLSARKVLVVVGIFCIFSVYYKYIPKGHAKVYDNFQRPFLANSNDSQRFFTWRNENACKSKKSFGGKFYFKNYFDGNKTLCLDNDVMPDPNGKCLIYSFGVNKDWSFEEAMQAYGCKVLAFDPSIGKKPFKYSDKIHFYDFGLGKVDDLSDPGGWKLRTLGTLLDKFGHTNKIIDVLKIDIEGAEYEALLEMLESGVLMNVKQIAMEVHNRYDDYYGAFWLLEQSFERFESLPNFACTDKNGTVTSHYCLELSWFNKRFRKNNI
ncbi:uncharacterized protein LOC136038959 [Artemia franciscana]|uniref:Methyltransferase domain-containing protein n=1 Tax=Artemia franciscana TaxID=6661 RepID=A0AA88L5H7_ARTSF|nr:hypothetical protein QYM36_006400 [Artemia franciscana]